MTVYADVLVIVNLYVDLFLLHCVQRFLHLNTRWERLVLGALAGALTALTGLLPLPPWAGLLAAGLGALAAAAGAFAPVGRRLFLQCWLCMWLFSFLLAGVLLFLLQFAPPGYLALVGGAVYIDLSLPMLFFSTCAAYLVFWLFRRLFSGQGASAEPLRLTIAHQGRQAELFAKADTGNALREPFSGLPVIVCQAKTLSGLAPAAADEFLRSGGAAEAGAGLRLVPFQTLGGDGLLPAFKPDRVVAAKTGQELECYLALSAKPLSAGQFSAIYNPELFPKE